MIQTITKYICDYCKSEVSMTEYTQGTKIDIRVSLENPKGGAGQVAGQSMNICKKCSEELGIINSEKYHDYTYSQGRLRDTIGEIKTKIINIFYRRNQQEIHDIKILPQYFGDIEKGVKSFEVRKNDRNYKVGDTLLLREWVNGEYTGRDIERKVTYVLDDKSGYVLDGYVVMSIT